MLSDRFCHDLIIVRYHLFELRQIFFKTVQDAFCFFGSCCGKVFGDQVSQRFDILLQGNIRTFYQILVQSFIEMVMFVQHIGNAARHSCGKVAAGSAKNDDRTARHIFTAVFTDTLDHRQSA